MDESINLLEKAKKNWENGFGLLIAIFLLIVGYFIIADYLFQDSFERLNINNFYLISILIIIIILLWYVSTNRFPVRITSQYKIAILINIDDEKYKPIIKELVLNSILDFKEIYSEPEFIFLPINYKKNSKEIRQFFITRGFLIDCLFWIDLKTGSFLNEENIHEKMSINFIKCMTRNDVSKSKKLYSSDLNISNDIKLTNFHKNWDYLSSSTYTDKEKYRYNLSELMLQFISIYLAYNNEFEKSVEILSKINQIENKISNSNEKNIFKKSRFNTIIIELLLSLIFKNFYEKKDYKECINLCNKLLLLLKGNNKFFKEGFSVLAFCNYKEGNIALAKYYTDQLKLKDQSNHVIVINEALFGIIENKPQVVAQKYRNLKLRFSKLEGADVQQVIEFLYTEKDNFKQIEIEYLFDFAIAFLLINYTDREHGFNLMSKFINNYETCLFKDNNILNLGKEQIVNFKKKKVA